MNPTPTSLPKTSKPGDVTTSEASKTADVSTKPGDTKSPETPAATASPKDGKATKKEKTRVVSTAFDSRTVRKLKLLASVENVSVASIVISSVTRTVNKRLPAALEALKSDLET